MSDLATLKAEIADDLDRTDLTASIAASITKAIRYFQAQRFYFNVTRDKTFATVASQSVYSSSDDADIPEFIEFDAIHVTNGGRRTPLVPIDIERWEYLTDNSAASGEPYSYAYYNMQLHLYPVPDQAYTVRMLGHYKVSAPASDAEANNVWMTEAYNLIRSRVCADLAVRKIRDVDLARMMIQAETLEMSRLMGETNKRGRLGEIVPTQF